MKNRFLLFIAPLFLFSCRRDHMPGPSTATGCDTSIVTYDAVVRPLLQSKCYSCHSGATLSGGVDLGPYNNVKFYADEGSLESVASRDGNFPPMPPDAANRLDDCQLAQLKKWIREGAPNN